MLLQDEAERLEQIERRRIDASLADEEAKEAKLQLELSNQELAMAMIGLPKSSSFMPVARQSARAPAMLRPWVVVRERYWGMVVSSLSDRKARIVAHPGRKADMRALSARDA